MLAVGGDPSGPPRPTFHPGVAPAGTRGPEDQPRAASRPVDVLLSPAGQALGGGGSGKQNPPRGRRTFRRCPHPHGGSLPFASFVSFLSGGVRLRTPRRWPPPSSAVPLLGLSPVKCTAAPKVASRRRHQVEQRSQPPRAAKCQRGLSAAGVFGFSSVTFSFDSGRWGWGRGGRPGGGRGGGSGRTEGTQSAAMDINTNTAAPAGLPRSQQAGCDDGNPPGGLGFRARGRGELSAPQHLLRGSSSPAAGRGRRLAEDSESLGSIAVPQRKSSRLAGSARLAVPRAMPARLSPSPSWRVGRLGHPERAGRGARASLRAAPRARHRPRPTPRSSGPPPGTCN